MGEPGVTPKSSPEVQEVFFNLIARSADTEAVNGKPMTIQWRFSDADPWHIRIDNGSTAAHPGLADKADVTFDSSWRTWIELSMQGEEPRRAILKRRLRAHGSPRKLLKMKKVFPPRSAPIV